MISLENQRRIDSAKREVVRHNIFAFELAPRTDNVVELGTVRVNPGKIDCRRKPSRAHHLDADPRLQSAASAERMSHVAFKRTDEPARSEDFSRSFRFRDVTVLGSGSMSIDVTDR